MSPPSRAAARDLLPSEYQAEPNEVPGWANDNLPRSRLAGMIGPARGEGLTRSFLPSLDLGITSCDAGRARPLGGRVSGALILRFVSEAVAVGIRFEDGRDVELNADELRPTLRRTRRLISHQARDGVGRARRLAPDLSG
jgi:hypothetical protein